MGDAGIRRYRWGSAAQTAYLNDIPVLGPFFKLTFLMLKKGDRQALFDHWLDVHVPNVREVMGKIGGFRYVVSHSLEPDTEHAGMADSISQTKSGTITVRYSSRTDLATSQPAGNAAFPQRNRDGRRIVTLPQPPGGQPV